ncbi:hypothetical protein ACFPN4_10810 [Ureibacillus thermophilus]|uniref:Uncharacterized protein n=1 Tax=Ureibacillus thermophilus TaxID=367743 RepID=A0A4P6UQ29_9BACL|nr:hypothetical protein [Ureibacillus thermophilus]QBK25153.1 hypothetical protein DKZ56_04350 [Ureibacillus thermophilus]
MYKYLSLGIWIITILMIVFSTNPNGYLLITLWIVGGLIGYIGKRNDPKYRLLNNLALWTNFITVIFYILWVYIVGMIWSTP